MQEFVIFLLNNWTWLLPVVLSVVESIFIIILKRRPCFNLGDKVWSELLYWLPFWICEAEKKYTTGAQKIAFVFECAIRFSPEFFSSQCNVSKLRNYIESILETPQKKGGLLWLKG